MSASDPRIQEFKSRLDITHVADRLGLRLDATGKTMCFGGHDRATPSLHVTQNGQGGFFYCYGCKRAGDVIHLVEEVRKTNFREAGEWLAQEFGLQGLWLQRNGTPPDEYDAEIARLVRLRKERQTVEAVLTAAATYFHAQLPDYLRENILKAKTPPPQVDVKDPVHRLHIIHKWLAEGLPKPDISFRLGISTRRLYQILGEYVEGDVKYAFGISQETGDSFTVTPQESPDISQIREATSLESPETVKSLPGFEGEMGVGCEGETALDPLDCEVMGEAEAIPSITVYGFDDSIIHDLLIGYAPPGNGLVHHLRAQGFSDEAIALSGLCLRDKGERLHPFFQGRLMFPYWKHGRVVYFIGRKTWYTPENQWEQGKYKKLLTRSDKRPYISETVSNEHFYNEDAAHGVDEVLITEGVTDCIAALQAGIPCISPVTVQFRDRDVPRLLDLTKHAKRLYLCNDVEENHAGEKGAIRTALKLEAAGRSVSLVTLPAAPGLKTDLNSYFLSNTKADFQRLLDESLTTLDFLVHSLPALPAEEDKGQRVEDIVRLLALARYKEALDETLNALKKACPKLRKEDLRKSIAERRKETIREVRKKQSGLPEIQVNNRQSREIIEEAWEALVAWNSPPHVFLRLGTLVRLLPVVTPQGTEQRLHLMDAEHMKELHTRFARWIRVTTEDIQNVRVQPDIAEAMRVAPDPRLPVIECVLRTPVFGRTGRLISEPGFHPEDAVWLDPNVQVPPVSPIPTRREVDEAKALLLQDLLVDFAFQEKRDLAYSVGMVLLPFVRRMIRGLVPLHVIQAPKMGTGKSTLADCVQIIALGGPPQGHTLPNNDEELKKVLTSILSTGDSIHLFDNIAPRRVLESEHLTALATRDLWKDRPLGFTKEVSYPNHALWMITGNNPRLGTELLRRCIRIRLDARTERPWSRSFTHQFPSWVFENRPRLIWACLTLVQHWIISGEPRFSGKPLGSFPEWSYLIGGILETHGLEGFLDRFDEALEESDEQSEPWREFVSLWWHTYRETPKTVNELNEFCDLHDLLTAVRGDKGDRSQQTRLGTALNNAQRTIYQGLQIQKNHRDHTWSGRKATYFLSQVDKA